MKEGAFVMYKRILAFAAVLLMLCGCGSQTDHTANGQSGKPFHVVLDWYPNAIHAFLYNAMEKGYYAEEGLDVQLEFPSNENDALSLVAAGKADVGIYYAMYVIQARAEQNVPVKSIGTVCQQQLSVVLSLKDKNITSPSDFVGKNIGYGGSPLSEALVKSMMKHEGVDPESVTMTDVGMDLMSAMTTDRVDATIGCMLNHEVPQLMEEGFDVNYFHMYDYGIPKDYEMVFVANDRSISERSDELEAFLRASRKGFEDMKKDPDGSLALLLSKQNADHFPLTESVEKQSMEILIPAMEQENAPFLSQQAEVWQEDIDWMTENGLLNHPIEVEDVMVNLDFDRT